ncbi:MAG: peptidyl-prolyl cis-trans isomerase [Candidatus Didemnitutus sp.]|nr:peptidyl-prolyl cis-trans isomerase [Candidatus Didemnitutus sp.]
MISWIQIYFQKHFRTVFAVLLGVTIISFIFTIGAAPGIGRAGNKLLEQPFYGHNLGSEQEARRIFRDGNFSAQLRGAYQASNAQLQEYSLGRIAGLALADDLHVPAPTEKELGAFIGNLPAFKNEQGAFDQTRYKQFEDSLKTSPEFTIADANRVFRDDARLEALGKIISGPGYVLPSDVAEQLKRSDATWSLAVASWDYASFDAGVQVNDMALQKFFDENAFRYEVPARPKLSLVEFKTAEFVPPVAPTEPEMRAFYEANKNRFPTPADDKKDATKLADASKTPTDDFPKVRAQVEQVMKDAAGRSRASKAANDFTVAVYERKVAANSADLTALLAAQHRTAIQLPAFTFDNPPADRPWLANYAEQISRLDKDRFFSDPVPSPDGYIVLLWNDSLPGHKPMLGEVKDKVAADYKEAEKRKRFVEAGKALRTKLQAAAKSGKFEDVAKAEKLEVKSYANFSVRQPPQDLPYAAYGAIQSFLDKGEVSEMVATGDKGVFTLVVDRKLPDTSTANPRYAEIQKQLAQYTAAANESATLSALVEAELKKHAPAKNAAP